MFQTNTQQEQVKVTNVNSWTGSNADNATTAFAIQNIGSKAVTLTDIKFRGIAVPNSAWYYCKDPTTCTSATSIQTPLPVDLANPPTPSTWTMTTPGPVSLSQGEAAIVYLRNAGNVQLLDAGNTYALQITAGQASSVTQVSVEAK
jgi:hypothetical protein